MNYLETIESEIRAHEIAMRILMERIETIENSMKEIIPSVTSNN